MKYQVLTRKTRPKVFADVMGHEAIVASLQKAIKTESVGHAYVFSGTRGIGKTSVARIFAKSLCCQNKVNGIDPCLTCESCVSIDEGSSLNVMEIDGASHNGVDHIRALIDGVGYLPSEGSHRVYIVDEVHMLSTSAFNALLKTLEEPPAHAVFILATTEPEKIPATVLSRCQKFNFKLASTQTLKDYLRKVLTEENISFENEECLIKLITLGQGSFRDTLSLVDQVMSLSEENKISEEMLWKSLGIVETSLLYSLSNHILIGDAKNVSKIYEEMVAHNVDLNHFSLDLLDTFFRLISSKSKQTSLDESLAKAIELEDYEMVELFWIYETLMTDLKSSLDSMNPVHAIEIALLKCTVRREFFKKKNIKKSNNAEVNKVPISTPAPKAKPAPAPASVSEVKVTAPKVEVKPEPKTETKIEQKVEEPAAPQSDWDRFISYAFSKNPAIAANLEQGNIIGEIDFSDNQVSMKIGFPKSGKVFWEYLNDHEVKARLITLLTNHFDKEESQIRLELTMIGSENKNSDFKTQAQIHAEKDSNRKAKMEGNIKENSMVNYAEKIFNSKVTRVDLFD